MKLVTICSNCGSRFAWDNELWTTGMPDCPACGFNNQTGRKGMEEEKKKPEGLPGALPDPGSRGGESTKDTGYWLSAEIDIPIRSKGEMWYRSTLPVIVQRAMTMRGVQSVNALNDTLPGTHIEHFNLHDHLRSFGLCTVTFWADKKGAYAAGALKNVTDTEKNYIKSTQSLIFRFKCFYYPEHPILYFVFSIPVSDKEGAVLHSVANFSDGDLQEFALSVENHRKFNLYLFDETYQYIKSFVIPLPSNTCEELIKMFDSANAYFNKLHKEHANFLKAARRFNEQYPDDFLP